MGTGRCRRTWFLIAEIPLYAGSSKNLKDLQKSPHDHSLGPVRLYHHICKARAFAVKVDTKRLPVFLFSGVDLYHDFRNDAF